MRMWCNDCREVVEIDERWQKDICCMCGGEDVEEANMCSLCLKPISPLEEYCDDCKETIYNIIDGAIVSFRERYHFSERRAISILQDELDRRFEISKN